MSKINVGKVLLGGLVAGIVLNIGEAVLNEMVLGQAMKDAFAKLNLQDPGSSFIVRAICITFLLGFVLVYLYAAIRPRFGAGPKTAICAGLMAWFFVYLYAGYINEALGIVPAQPFMIGLVWGLVEYPVAAVAGAWLYKEES